MEIDKVFRYRRELFLTAIRKISPRVIMPGLNAINGIRLRPKYPPLNQGNKDLYLYLFLNISMDNNGYLEITKTKLTYFDCYNSENKNLGGADYIQSKIPKGYTMPELNTINGRKIYLKL